MASSGGVQAAHHGSIPVGDAPGVASGIYPLRGAGACVCRVWVCVRVLSSGRCVRCVLGLPGSPFALSASGFTLPTVKRFSPTSGIGKPAVNRRKPLETAQNDNSNSKNRSPLFTDW